MKRRILASVMTLAMLSSGGGGGVRIVSALSSAVASTQIVGARNLGGTDLIVSEACLGTMTWGVQNDKDDAFRQLDYAIKEKGVNFIDTAELYPVPLFAPKWRAGATEEILGDYLHSIGTARRDDLVVASKIAGYQPNSPVAAARTVPPTEPPPDCRLDAVSVKAACAASLRRLKTDRIDLMQIHWPDRYVPVFGRSTFEHESVRPDAVPIEETASALRDLIEEGKIRYIGLSNESPHGVSEWIRATEKLGIRDRLASIQNSYNLLDRRFDTDLAETCSCHDIGLLPWSILAGGLLTGKYREGAGASATSRFVKYPQYMARWSPESASSSTQRAVEEYARIAAEAGMTPTQLAISFVRTRRFVADSGSVIVGATTLEQLRENLLPFDGEPVTLDDDVLEAINEVHMQCRNPSCYL